MPKGEEHVHCNATVYIQYLINDSSVFGKPLARRVSCFGTRRGPSARRREEIDDCPTSGRIHHLHPRHDGTMSVSVATTSSLRHLAAAPFTFARTPPSVCRKNSFTLRRTFSTSSSTLSTNLPPHRVGFVFDIDGVLKKGRQALPEAIKALQFLNGHNKYKVKIPFVLLTNGGGDSEVERAKLLSRDLKTKISPTQVVLSTSILYKLQYKHAHEDILVVGGPEYPRDNAHSHMKGYGMSDVYTPYDLLRWRPSAWPYIQLPKGEGYREAEFDKEVEFKAIVVFHDSRDWGRDIQIIIDVMRSKNGRFGTLASDEELRSRPQIPVYFTHGDLLWGNDFPVPRFGQGAFRHALSAVWQKTTGLPFEFTVYGKPERDAFELAEIYLWMQIEGDDRNERLRQVYKDMKVYMVGDNLASDIKGGKNYGWETALVRTGVYKDEQGEPDPKPTLLVDDVEKAVEAALKREWGEDALDVD